MKTNTVITYTASELKEQHPAAFKRAMEHYRAHLEPGWTEETFDSLKAVCKASDVTLRDWDLGAYNRSNHIRISFPHADCEELSGKRAIAWLENHLFGPLRLSFTARNRWELAKYNRGMSERFYMAGRVRPCPLTGYCADEDYLDALRKEVRHGSTLKEAFESLADVYARLVEAEYEAAAEEEYFIEHAEANEWQFTDDGDLF